MSDETVECGHWIWSSDKGSYDWMPWKDDSENIESYSDDDRTDDDSDDVESSDEAASDDKASSNDYDDEADSDDDAASDEKDSSSDDDEGDQAEDDNDGRDVDDVDHIEDAMYDDEDSDGDDDESTEDSTSEDCTTEEDTSSEEDTDNALIIYDFDDTLFPTTYLINELQNRTFARDIDEVELPDDLSIEVDKFETAVLMLLCDSLSLGTVKIVSNGSKSWVQSACRAVMPCLWDFIIKNSIEVISARDLYKDVVKDRWEHKKRVFENEVKKHTDVDEASAENFKFVSIGDAQYERYAAKKLKNIISKDCIKIIKLESDPTMKELESQMGMLPQVIRQAVKSDEFVDEDYGN